VYYVIADFSEDENILWSLELPPDVVEDSARADVSVVGDLLGPTLQVSTLHEAFSIQTFPDLCNN
jgi:hypothetical protein